MNVMEISSRRSNENSSEVRSMIDSLELAVDRRITKALTLPLRHGLGERIRSSPELKMDSPVYCELPISMIATSTAVPSIRVEDAGTPDSLRHPHHVRCTIDALDLAVDNRRISAAAGLPPLRQEPFRSSLELRVQTPLYGEAKSVSLEFPQTPATRSNRRNSTWKRSRRFVWKCLVNAARRICFCQSFVNVE